ncbi:peptidase inhibitor family I36 protein [Nonomuraea africana]|uniref:Peptidase inhibitor family I36 n=1 Tax=Nonomuraea africana TaxID=46171 RepID=A0ABR9K7Y5_9ACTN|nr:peptidase inhibitor family I36 protein [Nonomuraea africana]MBE1558125.1 hypothetical protein [Nonomuraea africana]
MNRIASLIAAAALLLVSTQTPVAAQGRPEPTAEQAAFLSTQATSRAELQRQIDLQMELYPGGTQIAPNEVSYAGGRFVVTYADPGRIGTLGSPDCPSGWFCFYDNTYFGYPRGKLSDWGVQDLSAYSWSDRTESVHSNTTACVSFWNHRDPQHPVNQIGTNDEWLFTVDNYTRSISNVGTDRNMADHVLRDRVKGC